jgi:hypothetical protein
MRIATQTEKESIENVYCQRCHLATPEWRARCIHCQAPLLIASNDERERPRFDQTSARRR